MNDLKSTSIFALSNSTRLNDSIGGNNNNNNNNNNNVFDFNSNGVILDIKNNNEQIFINGIKLGSLLPKISDSTKKVVKVKANEPNKQNISASITASISELAIESENQAKNKSKPNRIKKKKKILNDINWNLINSVNNNNNKLSEDLNNNSLMIVNNKQQLLDNFKEPSINRLPKLENANSYKQITAAFAVSNNNTNVYNNLQNDIKPVSFKLPHSNLLNTSNTSNNINESNLDQNRISKIVKKLIPSKDVDKLKSTDPLDSINKRNETALTLINRSLDYSFYEQHISQLVNTAVQNGNANKLSKSLNNTIVIQPQQSQSLQQNQKEDDLKDKRFRKKLIPIHETIKQNNKKIKKSIELLKIKLEDNEVQFLENSAQSFQVQNDSMLSMQSSYYNTNNVPLPVSQITIRPIPKTEPIKPSKPKTPKTSLSGDSKPTGRWSPIKITPMKSQKLFEKIKIESYDSDKLRELAEIFKELDTDEDGHLDYQIIEINFCQNFKASQKLFIYLIYQILSEPISIEKICFGLKEFYSIYFIIEQFKKLDFKRFDNYWDQFTQVDFEEYKDDVKEYIKLIDTFDLKIELKIGDVIKSKNKNFDSEKFFKNSRQQINSILMLLKCQIEGENMPAKLSSYVILIPLFIYLESAIKNKNLIKKNNNINNVLSMKEYSNYLKK